MNIANEIRSIKKTGLRKWIRWRSLQKAYIKENGNCAICGWDKKLNAHHIKPRHLFPELSLVWENLITLCRECHFRFGHELNWKNYNDKIEIFTAAIKRWKIYRESFDRGMNGVPIELKCPYCDGKVFINNLGNLMCETGHHFKIRTEHERR